MDALLSEGASLVLRGKVVRFDPGCSGHGIFYTVDIAEGGEATARPVGDGGALSGE